uniref:RNA-directed RNA polymerase n=1 Tax=Prasiola crispa toti-like virus TaxID=2933125 RepID=A0A9C7LLM8_9VIRU|nr:RNA-dependent RNA polymerase [Prasiola crispa toti-like virus]CAI5383883.1 RNA-dependent RNA polymerase [Prasiola crispa toti-like virus]
MYMACAQSGACGVEHYRRILTYHDVSVLDSEREPAREGPHPRNLHLGGTPFSMTISMVEQIIPIDSPARKLMYRDPDAYEFEIAGTMLWSLSLTDALLREMDEAGWWEVPINKWITVIKPKLERVRRTGMLGRIRDDTVYRLRKAANVTYRKAEEADWEKEEHNRTSWTCRKRLMKGGNYLQAFYEKAKLFEEHVVMSQQAGKPDKGMMDWWKRRGHNVPGGSTSSGDWSRGIFRDDPRYGKNDRPGKKTVIEALGDGTMEYCLAMPPANIARASTKAHEPARKRRSLYAANDAGYLVSAYASHGAEKNMKMWASRVLQSPDDFREWLVASQLPGYSISADMSDYNCEHELEELSIMNVARTRALLRWNTVGTRERARAAWWVARSHLNAWVEWPRADGPRRVLSGLFSGHRDTARDNTTKHTIDIELIEDDLRAIGYPVRRVAASASGDDEYTKWQTTWMGVAYLGALEQHNHDTNPKKQEGGSLHGEFLQVQLDKDSRAHRPLAALIATMASGNWYRPAATWFDSNIQGVSDNWWEAVARGLPHHAAHYLATIYLDVVMRIKREDGRWAELEWWEYRSPNGVHPLWGVSTPAPPVTRKAPRPHRSWPSRATDDWLDLHSNILGKVKKEKIELYRADLLAASHGSAFLQYRQRDLVQDVLKQWPKRIKRSYEAVKEAPLRGWDVPSLVDWYNQAGNKRAPRSDNEQAAWMGVDPQIVGLCGTWGDLSRFLEADQWARFADKVPPRQISIRCWASPWGFRSWAMALAVSIPVLHEQAPGWPSRRRRQKLAYVYAPNGAGKSVIARDQGWTEIDEVATKLSSRRPPRSRGTANSAERTSFIAETLRNIIDRDLEVVLGQYLPEHVLEAATMLRLDVSVFLYSPPREVLRRRLQVRGWSDEKIARREEWWVDSRNYINTPKELLLQLRKNGVLVHESILTGEREAAGSAETAEERPWEV